MRSLLVITVQFFVLVVYGQTGPADAGIAAQKSNLEYIDPTIGNVGHLLEPTRPIAHLPNQMIRVSPKRKDYLDDQISNFPLTIVSHRLGEVFSVKPSSRPVVLKSWEERMSYDHDLEINKPSYFSTYLVDEDITVEFAAAAKGGYYRFHYPGDATKSLLFGVYNEGKSQLRFESNKAISGIELYHGDIKVYMYGEFSHPGSTGFIKNNELLPGKNTSSGDPKVYISFDRGSMEIEFKYAISFVSAEQARNNFKKELAKNSFEVIATTGKGIWETRISQIKVEGGTLAQRRTFYTSLYRYYERMVDISEDSSYYSGFSKKIEKNNRPFYVDDWSWDTYLAMHPLRMILDPVQEEDMLQSYVDMYRQSGWMPTFPVVFGDHACMNGFHSSIIFLDAYGKGLRNFDIGKAYEGMKKNATHATLIPWRNGDKTELDDFYNKQGYFPALHPGEKEPVSLVHHFEKRQAVAVTLGHSYDDWALGELARHLDKKSDHIIYSARGNNYHNLWHPEKKMFLPRDAKGNWIPIDPKFDGGTGGRDYYDENNGWTYLWQVQHDIPGLINLMGGAQKFEDRLDQLFREGLDRSKYEFWNKFPDATGPVGQFSMGNEPSFHIPYLYNFTNSPWKTQKKIRFLLDTWFKDNVFGIPGDEDGGGMTAFVVFSAMGFYPVTPGLPYYTIGSPLFSRTTIDLLNGKQFQLDAQNCSVENKYIQSAKMNGKNLDTPWFSHEQLVNGGHLELEMGPKPNKAWGIAPMKPFALSGVR